MSSETNDKRKERLKAMANQNAPAIVLHVTMTESRDIIDYSNSYANIECRFRVYGTRYSNRNEWLNADYDWQNPTRFDVEDFVISGCMCKDQPTWKVYGWTADFSSPRHVDLERAERMVKTLKAIKAGLDKMKSEDGDIQSFGQYCLRICKALGCKQMSRASKWATDGVETLNLADGMYHVDSLITEQSRAWYEEGYQRPTRVS